nr:hypothetical protein [Salmonella enterica]
MTAGRSAKRKPDGADAYPAYMPGAKNKKTPRNFPGM